MQLTVLRWAPLAAAALATCASAHESMPRPESHAPAGVMADHTHAKGEVMTGYRYLRTSYSDTYYGSDTVEAADLAAAGYSMMATGMTMEMIMLDIMYAPTDNLTLMLMPMYMRMDMEMGMTGMDGQGHHNMDGMDEMPGHGTHDMHHSHGTSGWGDTNVSALYNWTNNPNHQFITTLGLNLPTGKVDIKNPDGTFVHYGMQIGSGTYDLTPSATYTGTAGIVSWGAQGSAVIRLEDENDSGYALGDKYAATAWGALRLVDWLSLSARVEWSDQDAISGHYNGPHNHSSPADIQANYGGEFLDAGIGINTVVTGGDFAGVRLGVEWMTRVEEDYNGYQLGLDDGVNVSLSYAF
ncbi:transporter [Gilvimarinus xylanilyticus]|uniref:Transporter n=1 Tax=Gilvimarinus xylanilyticus TaxID=2944139 RepID=A0A9X2HVK9_9GAMM|nr:transporter [Gilvimarinus xylanilyticus]MCP8897834.1 transporter [Gilvimarinus xylanilyticus]